MDVLRVVASVAVVASLAACGTGRTPLASPAARDVQQRAVKAGTAMSARTPYGSPAAEHARVVVGGDGEAQRTS